MTTIDAPVPGDPTGTALGVAFPENGIATLVEGLRAVEELTPSLAKKAQEIRSEIEDPKNPFVSSKMRLIRIGREVDKELLTKQRRVKVTNCDYQKVLALCGALLTMGPNGLDLLGKVLEGLINGGIPIKVEGDPKTDKSVFIKLYNESLEIIPIRPA